MPTTYDRLMAIRGDAVEFSYTQKSAILYALSVGMGSDPMNTKALDYLIAREGMKTMPTLSCVVSRIHLLLDAFERYQDGPAELTLELLG